MSNRWPGGLIRKTPITPTGPYQNGTASGVWSLADAAYWTKQGLWPIAGNEQLVVEDVFSTWLYTGNGSTQTITNGIDLAGKGGLVWNKSRSNADYHWLEDSARGFNNNLFTNATDAQFNYSLVSPTSSGFNILGSVSDFNANGKTYTSWTFREAPNFFDAVTWTGNGANRNIAHNLGSVPGMIIVKRTDTAADWQVYHRSNANTQYMVLNSTAAVATGATRWNSTTPTSTEFTVGTDAAVNASGGTYVAYLYAHDTSSTGLIQCGSYTGNGSATGPVVTLGWEPQWVMIKRATGGANGWELYDNMRGFTMEADSGLRANTTGAEFSVQRANPTATGFAVASTDTDVNASGETYIYMAIRRGPMKTPTLGTSVFLPIARTGTGANATITTGFTVDLHISKTRSVANSPAAFDRLRGAANFLNPASTAAEDAVNYPDSLTSFANNTGDGVGADSGGGIINYSPYTFANWAFRRAPGFFDVVAYTGNGSTQALTHNLGVVPELIIAKSRSAATSWTVYSSGIAAGNYMFLNLTNASAGPNTTLWGNNSAAVAPTSTAFTVGSYVGLNQSSGTYVAYLFASCPGVSKVGSYTGTGALQTINCAFTTGARFVLIKRTDSTGDWFVWDSARGISSGNDPYLLLNDISAEVTGTNYVDTDTTGFKVTAAAPAGINANGGTYIFLAIA